MFALTLLSVAFAQDLLITDVRVWDGTGAPARDGQSILIRDGLIAALNPSADALPGPVPVLDGAGALAIPGLIDLHTHLVSNPGGAWRTDDEASRLAQVHQALRAYVACGVTTVLDAGTLPIWAQEVHAWLNAGHTGPEVLDLGVALSPKGGYLDNAFPGYPSITDIPSLKAAMDASEALGSIGFKVAFEEGFQVPVWPVFDRAMRDAIVAEAAARHKPLYIHGGGVTELPLALEMKPRVLVHPPDDGSPAVIQQVIASGAHVTTTLRVADLFRTGNHPEWLTRPLVRLTVPQAQLDTATAEGMNQRYLRAVTDVVLPEWGPFRRHLAARVIGSERFNLKGLSVRGGTLRALVDAGVLVGMGSDSGNWPVFPYHFHGTNSLKEIELLGTWGLTPEQALLASTRDAARLIEVDGRVGTLEPGKEADIVLVRGDPLRVASDIWNIQGTVQDGVYRTPEGWMQEDARGL